VKLRGFCFWACRKVQDFWGIVTLGIMGVCVMVCILQGNLAVASVYAGSDSVQLKGDEIIVELYELLRLLTLCMLFSKKPFPVFLDSAGFSLDDVLIQKPKAGVCFVVIHSLSLSLLYYFLFVAERSRTDHTLSQRV